MVEGRGFGPGTDRRFVSSQSGECLENMFTIILF